MSQNLGPNSDAIDETLQSNLRKQIVDIQKNTKYSNKEKQSMIFSLFNKNKCSHDIHNNHNHSHDSHNHDSHNHDNLENENHYNTIINSNVTQSSRDTVKSLLTSIPIAGSEDKYILSSGGAWIQIPCSQLHPNSLSGKCEHYSRGCSIYTECCRKFYSCRLCHDAANDHTLNTKDVKVIRCHDCLQIQPSSNKCNNNMCKIEFGQYYCSTCKLWNSGVDIYHCDKCNICFIGKKNIDNKHCDICGYCMPISRYNDHVCCEYGDEKCALCLEDFKGCLGDIEKTKCGHIFHMSCMEKYISHDVCCPMCRKTLFDMSVTWMELDSLKQSEIIPEDFISWKIKFFCNDCMGTNEDKFSIYGNKCHSCSSYNTVQQDIIR